MADVNNISDEALLRVIREGGEVNWHFFALKVIIARLKLKLSMTSDDDEVMQQCLADIRDLFRRSSHIPNVKKDLQYIVEWFE